MDHHQLLIAKERKLILFIFFQKTPTMHTLIHKVIENLNHYR